MKLKLIRDPETGFQYSGGGYVLDQKIVTDVCKLNFCDLMNDLVLSPFLMALSTYSQPLPKDKSNQIAFGYNHHNLQLPGGYNIMPELSAAGLWTTPSDLARFGIAIMKALKSESRFLEKNTAELMTRNAYENSPYGLGLADITVKPHFNIENQQVLSTLLQISTELPICAMEDNSAIFVADDHISYTGLIHWVSKGKICPLSQGSL